jgi:hypothetical protein
MTEIKLTQICAVGNVLYGLDEEGRVWKYVCGMWESVYMTAHPKHTQDNTESTPKE